VRPPQNFDLTYISLGAGVQSSALLVCSALGLHRVVKADVAIFSDTQNEPRHVYEAVERLRAWAAPHGIPVETVTAGNLLDDAKARIAGTRSRFASIPLFTKGADGRAAPGRRQCTREYKITPIEKRVRALLGYKKGDRVKKLARSYIGISADEIYRVKPSQTKWVWREHPLVDARLTRADCIRIVLEAGLPMPKKSACVFCPYTDDARWIDMKKNDPASFEAACVADEALRDQSTSGLNHFAYVHRSLVPLRQIDFDEVQRRRYATPLFEGQEPDGFQQECEGLCGV
jgi:hypothetical protein